MFTRCIRDWAMIFNNTEVARLSTFRGIDGTTMPVLVDLA